MAAHAAGQPETDIGGDTATGTWSFQDTAMATTYRVVIPGAACYEDRYALGADRRWPARPRHGPAHPAHYSARSAAAVRMPAAQPAGSSAPATAIATPARPSAASSHPW